MPPCRTLRAKGEDNEASVECPAISNDRALVAQCDYDVATSIARFKHHNILKINGRDDPAAVIVKAFVRCLRA